MVGRTMREIIETFPAEQKKWAEEIEAGKMWGNWVASTDVGEDGRVHYWLTHQGTQYEIHVSEIEDIAELGDWVLHLQEKSWATVEDLGNFVKAIGDFGLAGLHSVDRTR